MKTRLFYAFMFLGCIFSGRIALEHNDYFNFFMSAFWAGITIFMAIEDKGEV